MLKFIDTVNNLFKNAPIHSTYTHIKYISDVWMPCSARTQTNGKKWPSKWRTTHSLGRIPRPLASSYRALNQRAASVEIRCDPNMAFQKVPHRTRPISRKLSCLTAISHQYGAQRCLQTYSEVLQFLWKRYTADNNISNLSSKVRYVRQEKRALTVSTQQVWLKTVSCGSVY